MIIALEDWVMSKVRLINFVAIRRSLHAQFGNSLWWVGKRPFVHGRTMRRELGAEAEAASLFWAFDSRQGG